MTAGITEKSYRHFWHVNQGEAELGRIAGNAPQRGVYLSLWLGL
jgi:hypothetical protein